MHTSIITRMHKDIPHMYDHAEIRVVCTKAHTATIKSTQFSVNSTSYFSQCPLFSCITLFICS